MRDASLRTLITRLDADVAISCAMNDGDFAVLLSRFPHYAACRIDVVARSISAPNYRDQMADGLLRGPLAKFVLDSYLDWTARDVAAGRFEQLVGRPFGPSLVRRTDDVLAECA